MLKIRPATPEEVEQRRRQMEAKEAFQQEIELAKKRFPHLVKPNAQPAPQTPPKGMVIEPPKYSSSSDVSDSPQNANANNQTDSIETRRKLPIDRSKIRLNKERANGMVLEPPYRPNDDAGDEG